MSDAERKAGVLNSFDASQKSVSWKGYTGTLPFMALDLLSEKGIRGEIPRLYRHDAESFSWVLTFLCVSIAKNKKGKNWTLTPNILHDWSGDWFGDWFGDWVTCRNSRLEFKWQSQGILDAMLAYPNAKILARSLHGYWLDRYHQQFQSATTLPWRMVKVLGPGIIFPPYVEKDDDTIFRSVAVMALKSEVLKGIRGTMVEMYEQREKVYWTG